MTRIPSAGRSTPELAAPFPPARACETPGFPTDSGAVTGPGRVNVECAPRPAPHPAFLPCGCFILTTLLHLRDAPGVHLQRGAGPAPSASLSAKDAGDSGTGGQGGGGVRRWAPGTRAPTGEKQADSALSSPATETVDGRGGWRGEPDPDRPRGLAGHLEPTQPAATVLAAALPANRRDHR